MKLSEELQQQFERDRYDYRMHIGAGDIHLTIGDQEEIIKKIQTLEDRCRYYALCLADEFGNCSTEEYKELEQLHKKFNSND